MQTVPRLVLLSGPSCVGKGPLVSALGRHHPELATQLTPLVLYNSRDPRPAEVDGVDYHFRPRADIERLALSPGFVAGDVRGDFQGLELAAIDNALEAGRDVFFEGNPFIPEMLREAGVLDRYPTLTVFLSPLDRDEITYLKDPEHEVDLGAFISDVMRRKLLRRTTRQKTHLSKLDLEDIERRATSAIAELRHAHKYEYVIPNHDGEDSENWDAFYHPIGDAFVALESFAALLQEEAPKRVERWDAGLIPPAG